MASTGKQKIPFLPLTRLQRAILEEHFRKRGHGEGYQRTYQRLKLAIGDKDHYAMDDNGNIARTDDGEIYEEVDEPIKVMNQTYNYNGTDYTLMSCVFYYTNQKKRTLRNLCAYVVIYEMVA